MRVVLAARIYLALTAVVVLFQLGLTAGAPWGNFTMGGAFPGQLPIRMRLAALGSAVLLVTFAAIVGARAGIALRPWRQSSRWLIWFVVGYSVLGVLLNTVTPSWRERALWLPVTVVLGVCALIVARGDA